MANDPPLQQYLRLKREAEQARREADREAGAAAQIEAELAEEFGCADLAAGRQLLARLEREERAARGERDRAIEGFAAEFHQRLTGAPVPPTPGRV